MKTTWLILDCHYLCWRNYHALKGQISQSGGFGHGTEVLFSFIRDITFLQTMHNTRRVVFCFDSPAEKRIKLYPEYKQKRKNPDQLELKDIARVKKQIRTLRKRILPELGYKNIFYQKGYEADDLIASICQNLKSRERAIIVASDSDLYQLISEQVICWNPRSREPLDLKTFKKVYGITPSEWPKVKALAGCTSDNVKGIDGVGEITALRYLRGELREECKAIQSIKSGKDIIRRNMKLVKLPLPGVMQCSLKGDHPKTESFDHIIKRIVDKK